MKLETIITTRFSKQPHWQKLLLEVLEASTPVNLVTEFADNLMRYRDVFRSAGLGIDEMRALIIERPDHSAIEVLSDTVRDLLLKHRQEKLLRNVKTSRYKQLFNDHSEDVIRGLLQNGLSEKLIKSELFQKIARYKTAQEFSDVVDRFAQKHAGWSRSDYLAKMAKMSDDDVVVLLDENDKLVIEVKNYATSKALGSESWCIVTQEHHYAQYVKGDNRQFFLYEFDRPFEDNQAMIGITLDVRAKGISACHLKNDRSADEQVSCRAAGDVFRKADPDYFDPLVTFKGYVQSRDNSNLSSRMLEQLSQTFQKRLTNWLEFGASEALCQANELVPEVVLTIADKDVLDSVIDYDMKWLIPIVAKNIGLEQTITGGLDQAARMGNAEYFKYFHGLANNEAIPLIGAKSYLRHMLNEHSMAGALYVLKHGERGQDEAYHKELMPHVSAGEFGTSVLTQAIERDIFNVPAHYSELLCSITNRDKFLALFDTIQSKGILAQLSDTHQEAGVLPHLVKLGREKDVINILDTLKLDTVSGELEIKACIKEAIELNKVDFLRAVAEHPRVTETLEEKICNKTMQWFIYSSHAMEDVQLNMLAEYPVNQGEAIDLCKVLIHQKKSELPLAISQCEPLSYDQFTELYEDNTRYGMEREVKNALINKVSEHDKVSKGMVDRFCMTIALQERSLIEFGQHLSIDSVDDIEAFKTVLNLAIENDGGEVFIKLMGDPAYQEAYKQLDIQDYFCKALAAKNFFTAYLLDEHSDTLDYARDGGALIKQVIDTTQNAGARLDMFVESVVEQSLAASVSLDENYHSKLKKLLDKNDIDIDISSMSADKVDLTAFVKGKSRPLSSVNVSSRKTL
jgi:hypothetical protein